MISNRSEELFTNLKKFLKEECDIREQDISLQTNIRSDLDLSSFDLINLLFTIEEKYKVVVPEEKYLEINTIGDLVEYIDSQVNVMSNV